MPKKWISFTLDRRNFFNIVPARQCYYHQSRRNYCTKIATFNFDNTTGQVERICMRPLASKNKIPNRLLLLHDCNSNNVGSNMKKKISSQFHHSFSTSTTTTVKTSNIGLHDENLIKLSVYDTSNNWEDWFSPEEYENSWDSKCTLLPLYDQKLDSTSRHVLRLLNNLYHNNGTSGDNKDLITKEWCNDLIEKLENLQVKDNNDGLVLLVGELEEKVPELGTKKGQEKEITLNEQLASRADAVLKQMELFYNLENEIYLEKVILSSSFSTSKIKQVDNNINQLYHQLPVPDYKTYSTVLRSYGRVLCKSTRTPLRCMEIISKMENEACRHCDEVGEGDVVRSTKNATIKPPSVEDYNLVLLSWANCTDSEKALHATKFLRLMNSKQNITINEESYRYTLLACCAVDNNNDDPIMAKKIGSAIAIELWNGLIKDEKKGNNKNRMKFGSQIYTYFIKACGNIQGSDTIKDTFIEDAFNECCLDGMMNNDVMKEIKLNASNQLYSRILERSES